MVFYHLEKYESQWEGWHPIYYEMESKKCYPPTIQYIYIYDASYQPFMVIFGMVYHCVTNIATKPWFNHGMKQLESNAREFKYTCNIVPGQWWAMCMYIELFNPPVTLGNYSNYQIFLDTTAGWWFQPLWKNMKVSWDDDIPNIWKVMKFHGSKPPTR